jgi:hypothetical protein
MRVVFTICTFSRYFFGAESLLHLLICFLSAGSFSVLKKKVQLTIFAKVFFKHIYLELWGGVVVTGYYFVVIIFFEDEYFVLVGNNYLFPYMHKYYNIYGIAILYLKNDGF